MKMQDLNMTYQNAGVDNAGPAEMADKISWVENDETEFIG